MCNHLEVPKSGWGNGLWQPFGHAIIKLEDKSEEEKRVVAKPSKLHLSPMRPLNLNHVTWRTRKVASYRKKRARIYSWPWCGWGWRKSLPGQPCPMRPHKKFGSKVVGWWLGMQLGMTKDFSIQWGTKNTQNEGNSWQKMTLKRREFFTDEHHYKDTKDKGKACMKLVPMLALKFPLSCCLRNNQL